MIGAVVIKVIMLLLVIILPLRSPQKRRKSKYTRAVKIELSKSYYVNEQGKLIEMSEQNIS